MKYEFLLFPKCLWFMYHLVYLIQFTSQLFPSRTFSVLTTWMKMWWEPHLHHIWAAVEYHGGPRHLTSRIVSNNNVVYMYDYLLPFERLKVFVTEVSLWIVPTVPFCFVHWTARPCDNTSNMTSEQLECNQTANFAKVNNFFWEGLHLCAKRRTKKSSAIADNPCDASLWPALAVML